MDKYLMTLGEAMFAAIFAVGFIACILFVIFGQVTVRKLRKNPATKHALGFEFTSGWDIFNVAFALALPKAIARRIKRNSISMGMGSGFEADPDILYKQTTVFDRVLARMFFASWVFSGFGIIIFGVLDLIFNFD
ncbi:MAG: hypothetical protein L3J70_12040 [Gammaproteobacteria bacterium]|nr:hypothetical protein [Gammaproteobacteria bacterium]